MPKITVNGVTYAYEDRGRGAAVVVLHGFTGSKSSWRSVGDVLEDNFRVITVDLLGHGQTAAPDDPNRYRMGTAAADLIALADHLESGPFHLLGYSMGGRLALFVALHYPDYVNSLILESASPGLAGPEERAARRHQDEALAEKIEREGVAPFVDFWEALPLWHSQAQLDLSQKNELRNQRLQNRLPGLANSLRGMGTGAQPSLWDHLPKIDMPTFLIVGELDTKFVAINHQMAAALPHSSLEVVPNAGHTVHLEQPAVFGDLIKRFWRRTAVGQ